MTESNGRITPIIDRLQLLATYGFMVSERSDANNSASKNYAFRKRLKSNLKTTGFSIGTRIPKRAAKKKRKLESMVIIGSRDRGYINLSYCLMGNGVVWLREKYEPETRKDPPIDLAGNINLFKNDRLYGRCSNLLDDQIAYIESVISEDLLKIDSVLEQSQIPRAEEWKLNSSFELAFDYKVSCPMCELRRIWRNLRFRRKQNAFLLNDEPFPYLSYYACKNVIAKAYQKGSRVRFELSFQPDFFNREGCRRQLSELRQSLDEAIDLWREEWSRVVDKPLNASRRMSSSLAMKSFREHGGKHWSQLVNMFSIGDGRIKVFRANGPIYNQLRILSQAGIVSRDRDFMGEYVLHEAYESLIDLAPPESRMEGIVDLEEPKCVCGGTSEGLNFHYLSQHKRIDRTTKLILTAIWKAQILLDGLMDILGVRWMPQRQEFAVLANQFYKIGWRSVFPHLQKKLFSVCE